MLPQQALATERLILRPLTLDDAPRFQQLAGRREIADTMVSIPHPCSEQQAKDWITAHTDACAQGKSVIFAIESKQEMQLIGTAGLRDIDQEHCRAEMGMWIGVEWWGRGYATEAARAILDHGFESLGLNRIYDHHMVRNPASGRVLEKIGMMKEGLLRQPVRKWGKFEDVVVFAIVRDDWSKAQPFPTASMIG
jgi:[ribosomal protein S5]-alanine N-acetyltransferase